MSHSANAPSPQKSSVPSLFGQPETSAGPASSTSMSDAGAADLQKTSEARKDSARGSQGIVMPGTAQQPSVQPVNEDEDEDEITPAPAQTDQPGAQQPKFHAEFQHPRWSPGTDHHADAAHTPQQSHQAMSEQSLPANVPLQAGPQDNEGLQPLLPNAETADPPVQLATNVPFSPPNLAASRVESPDPILKKEMRGKFDRSGPYKIPPNMWHFGNPDARRHRSEWTARHKEQWLYREPIFDHVVVPMTYMEDVLRFLRALGGDFGKRADLLEVVCHME